MKKSKKNKIYVDPTIQPITMLLAPVSVAPGFTPPTETGLPGPSTLSGKPKSLPPQSY